MQKIFIEEKNWDKEKNIITITEEEVNHIKNVLRYKEGNKIETKIIGETLPQFLCEIINIEKTEIYCKIIEEMQQNAESSFYLHIIQGLPKSDKMEQIIEKGTELGVKEFTPLNLKRCITKIDTKEEKKKIERWQKIALTAAKQCKRNIIPKINSIHNVKNIFDILEEYDIVIIAYEEEKKQTLKKVLKEYKKNKNIKIAILIGPEGGLEKQEVEELIKKGAKAVSLGQRILRTETVAITLASILMYELGDLGG